jgi:hypothetical protein
MLHTACDRHQHAMLHQACHATSHNIQFTRVIIFTPHAIHTACYSHRSSSWSKTMSTPPIGMFRPTAAPTTAPPTLQYCRNKGWETPRTTRA